MTTSIETSELRILRSALLASLPGVTHAITGRVPGMGVADGNLGYSAPRDKADAWAMRQQWCAAAGLAATSLVTLGQIHGTVLHVVSARHAGWGATPGSTQIGLGDALATDEPGPVLMTLHADCQPVLFVDPPRAGRGAVVAVAHAGWRGAVDDVVGQTLGRMREAFGSQPRDVHVYLAPAIGGCCYEVGEDVVRAWRARAGADAAAALRPVADKYRFSLTSANVVLLDRAGVQAAHVEQSDACTRCQGERWFSHRGQGPAAGRFGAMIAITR